MWTEPQLEAFAATQPRKLVAIVLDLQVRLHVLQARLAQNSRNSSQPPSRDGTKKPLRTQSSRGASHRKPGGQPGHAGRTLRPVSDPDHVIRHAVSCCEHCHVSLADRPADAVEHRQVVDIPPVKVEVTEHQGEIKVCPRCGTENRAAFPAGVDHPVAYGPWTTALALYFTHQQLIPFGRSAQMLEDLFALPMSLGTLCEMTQRGAAQVAPAEQAIKEQIIQSNLAHFDETGMRCENTLQWLHVASTARLTAYAIHRKRGTEAMETMGILPRFRGHAVHDHWQAYFDFDCAHVLCNTHHVRELTFTFEQEHEAWASKMKTCLLAMYRAVERSKARGATQLVPALRRRWEYTYDRIVRAGFRYHARLPPLPGLPNRRGRQKQRPGKNLLDRLKRRRQETLAFLQDFSIPFTNNLGERDIRMSKVKQKISGCFRSVEGAQAFCRIRGYISTARKQGWNILDALECACRGSPRIPKPSGQAPCASPHGRSQDVL